MNVTTRDTIFNNIINSITIALVDEREKNAAIINNISSIKQQLERVIHKMETDVEIGEKMWANEEGTDLLSDNSVSEYYQEAMHATIDALKKIIG